MRPVLRAPLPIALTLSAFVLAACPPPRALELAQAEARLEHGDWRGAEHAFDEISARPTASARERVRAWTGAGVAADKLGDGHGACARFSLAAAADLPGESEPAMYHLADCLRDDDRARALNLYYRAAAGAEKYRSSGFPYRAAMDRILQLSMTR